MQHEEVNRLIMGMGYKDKIGRANGRNCIHYVVPVVWCIALGRINVIKLAPQPSREGNKMLKEPLKKRRHLVR